MPISSNKQPSLTFRKLGNVPRPFPTSDFYLDTPETYVYIGDCRAYLSLLPASCVNLIFADPPFNWGVDYDNWEDNQTREDYLKFTYEWLEGCLRVLHPHGTLWVNIPDDTAAEIIVYLKKRGLHLINWCLWHFRFGQHTATKFITSKVHALYFVKDPSQRTWNSDAILEPSDRAAVYGDARTESSQQPGMRVPLDVWYGPNWGRIQGNNKERRPLHHNQLPEVYLERVIRSTSNEGDLVLDPFLGSGTTCTIARALNRRSIGIEHSAEYSKSAFERIVNGPIRL